MFSKSLVFALFGFLAVSAVPTPAVNGTTPLATVYTACVKPKTIAYTFGKLFNLNISYPSHEYKLDDGPYIYNTDIVKTLTLHGAKATFFVNGDLYSCIYNDENVKSLRIAYALGHQIASHTWAHKDLTTLNVTEST